MGYYEIGLLARDPDFETRVAACYGTETMAQDPESWAVTHQWLMASQPGFGEAYSYAVNAGTPNPGRDPSVITDPQILSAVQLIMADEDDDQRPDVGPFLDHDLGEEAPDA